jgi:hypothetical protein
MKRLLPLLLQGAFLCLSSIWLATEGAAQLPVGQCSPSSQLDVIVGASPDLDPGQAGTQVRTGTRVQLSGSAIRVRLKPDCELDEQLIPLTWSLFVQPAGGTETDVTSSLASPTSQKIDTPSVTSFTANQEGTYRARIRGGSATTGFKTVETLIVALPPPPGLFKSCGKLTFLRGHDVGSGFGPPTDFIDVEVVTRLNSQPSKFFGFQLRNDTNGPARQGMLDLLRDGFNNNWTVCLDYFLVPTKNNGVIIRVELTK